MKFNANDVPPAADFGPLPNGPYRVRVDSAIEVENKNHTGKYLELVLVVVEGAYKARKLWLRMTSEHDNEQAASIGRGQISACLRALGKPVINHESELVGCVGECRVGREKNDPERNEVKGWVTPAETKGAPTYSRQHQAAGAEQHGVNRPGAALKQATSGPRTDVPAPGYFDDDVPF